MVELRISISKMKLAIVVLLCLVASGFAEDEVEVPLAKPCDPEACKLPDCRCSTTEIPGGLRARDTPQLVLFTLDDGVNVLNMETYKELFNNRANSNGCKIGATFFVNHEYTNYQLVNELYNEGYEIALHSITHKTDQIYWRDASKEDMIREFCDQKKQISHFANIPEDGIKGVRIPFLQMNGNSSFLAMAECGLEYDATWPTITYINPGLWPYSLDYASTHDCVIGPCPTASIPKTWVLPMVSWIDLAGTPCSMVDSCYNIPNRNDADAWFDFILTNFERHYLGNRSPFGFFVHEWFINNNPGVKAAVIKFIDLVTNLQDAFLVNARDAIAWVKNPVPLNEYVQQNCQRTVPRLCPTATCPIEAEHNQVTYWMAVCTPCPRAYPWLGNPLGE